MSPPLSHPNLLPETVPGGSLIGSVNSRFAATFTLSQSKNNSSTADSQVHTSFTSSPSLSAPEDANFANLIQSLSRPQIECLVTRAWIRNIPNQSDDKLRDLVSAAVKRGILDRDNVTRAYTDSFTCLPTKVVSSAPY